MTIKDWATRFALFVFVAIPGALLFVFASIYLIVQFVDKELEIQFLYPILLSILGAFATLIGLQKLREWKYIFVFLSFPLTLLLVTAIVMATGLEPLAFPLVILSLFVPFFVNKAVSAHYQRIRVE